MKTSIDEIAPGIDRICLYPNEGLIGFNHFLIRDEWPALIHLGHRKTFPVLLAAVATVINPACLRYLAFSHLEADESGALMDWLDVAPQAEVCVGKLCASSVKDMTECTLRVLRDGETISLGRETLRLLETPHFPHNWDACLFYAEQAQVLFGSDLGTQPGDPPVFRAEDPTEEIIALQRQVGYLAYGSPFARALEKLQALEIDTLAAMHGSMLTAPQARHLLARLAEENAAALAFAPV